MTPGRKAKVFSPETVAGVIKEYQQNIKLDAICFGYKIERSAIYRILKENHIPARHPEMAKRNPGRGIQNRKDDKIEKLQGPVKTHPEPVKPGEIWLEKELQRLAGYSKEYDLMVCNERVFTLLLAGLEVYTEQTLTYLGYKGIPFTTEDLVRAAQGKFLHQVLMTMTDVVEEVSPGHWKLKEGACATEQAVKGRESTNPS